MKIKDSLLAKKEQEQFKEIDVGYEEFLRANNPEPTSCELDAMEKVFCKAKILKANKYPLNNLYYQPLQGA